MKEIRKKSGLAKLLLVPALVAVDLLGKIVALSGWRVSENSGVGLGLFEQLGLVVSFFGVCLLIGFWRKFGVIQRRLLLAGALGNLIDRWSDGRVLDYIFVERANLWLNISDIYLSLGVMLGIGGEIGRKYDKTDSRVRG